MQQSAKRSVWIIAGVPISVLILLLGGCSSTSIIQAALAFMLCAAAGHDLVLRRIENGTVLAAVLLRVWELALAGIADPSIIAAHCASSLAGAATVLAVLLGTARIMERRSGTAGIGGGDVKLLASLGALLGWRRGLLVLALSGFFAAAAGAIGHIRRRFSAEGSPDLRLRDATVPMAPAIALACIFAALV